MAERENNLTVEQTPAGFREPVVPHPITLAFLRHVIETGVFYTLDKGRRQLVSMYYFSPGMKLKDLRGLVNPKSGKRVKEVMFQALDEVWEKLTPDEQDKFSKKDVIRLKHQSYSHEHIQRMKRGPSNATRTKLSEAAKRTGFPPNFEANRLKKIRKRARPAAVRTRISVSLQRRWSEAEFRDKMLRILAERNIDRQLWEAANSLNLTKQMVEKGILTQRELETLRKGFASERPRRTISRELMEKFSIAVANLA